MSKHQLFLTYTNRQTLQPIAIQVEYDSLTRNYTTQYSAGLKIPHLERDTSKPDMLSAIISPHAQ